MSGGVADFTWTRALGGLFSFEATGFTGAQPPQALAWYSLYVVTCGSVTLRRGDEEWTAREGMVALLSPDDVYARSYSSVGCSLRGVFPTAKALAAVPPGIIPAMPNFRSPVVDDPRLASCILAATAPHAAAGHQDAQLHQVFTRLADRHLAPVHARERREHRAIRLVKRQLRAWQGDPPSLSALASLASLSRFHLSRIFSESEGLTPYAYYEQVRLARARYLIHGGATLSHAAHAVGFTDQSHLTRHFRASLAMTPGTYARAVRAARAEA